MLSTVNPHGLSGIVSDLEKDLSFDPCKGIILPFSMYFLYEKQTGRDVWIFEWVIQQMPNIDFFFSSFYIFKIGTYFWFGNNV